MEDINILKVTASGDAVLAGRKIVKKVILVGGSDAASVIVFSGATQASPGVDVGKIVVPANTTKELKFGECGKAFEKGVSLTITGTSPAVYIHY